MYKAIAFLLLFIWSCTLHAEDELRFPDWRELEGGSAGSSYSRTLHAIFCESGLTLRPKRVPDIFRVMLELVDGNLDVAVLPIHEKITPKYVYENVELYPEIIYSLPVSIYILKGSRIKNVNRENFNQFRLGLISTPKLVAEAYYGFELHGASYFSDNASLIKALLAERIEVAVLAHYDVNEILEDLGAEGLILRTDILNYIDFYLAFRKGLPKEMKEKINDIMNGRSISGSTFDTCELQ
jgi:hypothetical protein